MVYGYVPTMTVQRALKQQGLAQKVDAFLETTFSQTRRPINLAGIPTSVFEYVSFRDEDEWQDIEKQILSGELMEALGIDALPTCGFQSEDIEISPDQWSFATFFYFAMRAKDELLRRNPSCGYFNYSWQKGDTKRWLINLEDDGFLSSVSTHWRNKEAYAIDLNFGHENNGRVREIKCDKYEFWPLIFATFLKFARQSRQTHIDEVAHPEKFLSPGDLKPYNPESYSSLGVDEFWLKQHFKHDLPFAKRDGTLYSDRAHFDTLSERRVGAIYPYLTESDGRVLLNFGILPPFDQVKEWKDRKKHFTVDGNRPMVRHMTLTPEELPDMMRGVFHCYDSVKTQMGYIHDFWRKQG